MKNRITNRFLICNGKTIGRFVHGPINLHTLLSDGTPSHTNECFLHIVWSPWQHLMMASDVWLRCRLTTSRSLPYFSKALLHSVEHLVLISSLNLFCILVFWARVLTGNMLTLKVVFLISRCWLPPKWRLSFKWTGISLYLSSRCISFAASAALLSLSVVMYFTFILLSFRSSRHWRAHDFSSPMEWCAAMVDEQCPGCFPSLSGLWQVGDKSVPRFPAFTASVWHSLFGLIMLESVYLPSHFRILCTPPVMRAGKVYSKLHYRGGCCIGSHLQC